MAAFFADLRVWWAQLLFAMAKAHVDHTGGSDSPYMPALKAAMAELDEAVKAADDLRKDS